MESFLILVSLVWEGTLQVFYRLPKERLGQQTGYKINDPATICLACKMYWGNDGAEFVEVAKQRLVYLQNHARRGCTFSTLPGWPGTRDWIAWTPKVEPNR